MATENGSLSTAESLRKTRPMVSLDATTQPAWREFSRKEVKKPPNARHVEWNTGSTGLIPTCLVFADRFGM